jgi:hypothetical protein
MIPVLEAMVFQVELLEPLESAIERDSARNVI